MSNTGLIEKLEKEVSKVDKVIEHLTSANDEWNKTIYGLEQIKDIKPKFENILHTLKIYRSNLLEEIDEIEDFV